VGRSRTVLAGAANPPILHRKETFLTLDHPLSARFARLTAQEENHGRLDDSATIGTRDGWEARLEEAAGFALRGHRLIRRRVTSRALESASHDGEAQLGKFRQSNVP
jgi:hypothetical protein